jgi:hypothetical protein
VLLEAAAVTQVPLLATVPAPQVVGGVLAAVGLLVLPPQQPPPELWARLGEIARNANAPKAKVITAVRIIDVFIAISFCLSETFPRRFFRSAL